MGKERETGETEFAGIKIYELGTMSAYDREKIMRRSRRDIAGVKKEVLPIIDDIRILGDEAVLEYLEEFDGVKLTREELVVSPDDIDKAYTEIDPSVLRMIREQIKLSRQFHQAQLAHIDTQWEEETIPGVFLGQKKTPIGSAGLYIPGGTAPYPTVMQTLAVPAKVAGVKRIAGTTPPRGKNYEVIVAAKEAGVDELYRIGGIAAIAALTYGTETVKPVDKIAGPGNIYVTAAKMLVFGDVGIDMPAGPSEGLVIADEGANPLYCALDILACAEHDTNAAGILVTWSKEVARRTQKEISRQLASLPRKAIAGESLAKYSAIIVVPGPDEAIKFANEYAPEHLEVLTAKPYSFLPGLNNAGSIFLGEYASKAVGDYASGANHVLPTGGWAKVFSPVGVETFIKSSQTQFITKEGLESLSPIVETISRVEGLDAHRLSVAKRLDR